MREEFGLNLKSHDKHTVDTISMTQLHAGVGHGITKEPMIYLNRLPTCHKQKETLPLKHFCLEILGNYKDFAI